MNSASLPATNPLPSLAFVLAGGASAAAYQVGALRALAEAHVTPDLVIGTSAGALNAAAYATDPTPGGVERLAAAWRTVRRSDLFPLRPWTLLQGLTGRSDHLCSPQGLERWVAAHVPLNDLGDSSIPLHVVATDLEAGSAVVLSRGPCLTALLASTALPGVYPPVPVRGRLLVDGGLAADTPVHQAQALGATDVIVLGTFSPTGLRSPLARSGSLGWYAYEQVFAHWSSEVSASNSRISVVPLPPRDGRGPFDFSTVGSRIDHSYELARAWLAEGVAHQWSGAHRHLSLVH